MRPPAPPGQLIDVGGYRLHLNCQGEGTPAVILDAALGASSISWSLVQPEVARFTQVCAADRAGLGWSDAGPMPRTAGRVADELRVLLERAAIPPPYVLVGHSFGGLVMRIFAKRYAKEAAALVLVDPAHPEDWIRPAPKEQAQIDRGVRLCRRGTIAARWGIARSVVALVNIGALTPARGLAKLVSRGALASADESILAPMWKLPPETRRPLRYFWTQTKFFEALESQIGSICESAAETLVAAEDGYGDLPLVTISCADPGSHRMRQQEALARLSTRGRHVIASSSGHWVPLDEPQLVADIVSDVVFGVRGEDRAAPRSPR